MKETIGVILAAGKGKRMKATTVNKTAMKLAGRPMIAYTVELLEKAGLKKIIMVVGFAKDSIIDYFGKAKYTWVVQKRQLGTADAVKTALKKIPADIKNVLIIQGDDSAFYKVEIIKKLIRDHQENEAVATFLTVKPKNPAVGRVIRDREGNLKGIVEVKNATAEQLKIKEINTGCYCFKRNFLAKYLSRIKKNPITEEYHLPDLVNLGLKGKEKIKAVLVPSYYFQGVNTPEEFEKADRLMKQRLHDHPDD